MTPDEVAEIDEQLKLWRQGDVVLTDAWPAVHLAHMAAPGTPASEELAASLARDQVEPDLEYFQIEAVTPRADAQGQAHVRIRANDKLYTGHGLATDVVEASARAYIAALSRLDLDQPSTVIAGSSTSRWT